MKLRAKRVLLKTAKGIEEGYLTGFYYAVAVTDAENESGKRGEAKRVLFSLFGDESFGLRFASKHLRIMLLCMAAASLTGCATLGNIDQPQAMHAYTACAAADVATTTVGLATHTMLEGNPIARAMFIKALGPVVGMVAPVIALEVAGYFILRAIDRPAVTAGAAALTCAASIRNVGIIGAAK